MSGFVLAFSYALDFYSVSVEVIIEFYSFLLHTMAFFCVFQSYKNEGLVKSLVQKNQNLTL